jgi:Protein of unknown function, DUF547
VLSRQHPVSGARPPAVIPALVLTLATAAPLLPDSFDHSYRSYGELLTAIVRGARVDYRELVSRKPALEATVREFGASGAIDGWTKDEQKAFWINAYNVFTLKAIADRYPIRGGIFSLQPRNSIRQIDGVWTDLRFKAASREVSLDDIEHRILRPEFKDARVHFAINCASVSCPPLREEPYVPSQLDIQLDDAARRYLASDQGVRVNGRTLRVSSIFDWYGDDFVPAFAGPDTGGRSAKERAILGAVVRFGPPAAPEVARAPGARVRFLRYDWSLNDTIR